MLDRFLVTLESKQGIVRLLVKNPTAECVFTDVYLRLEERVVDWRGRFGKRGWSYANLRRKPKELDTISKDGGAHITGLVLNAEKSAELSQYLDAPYKRGRDDAQLIFEVGHDLWTIPVRKGRAWTGDYKAQPW